MKFIYIASPYTIGDVAENVRINIEAADQVARAGFVPFVPLLNHFWHLVKPHPPEFWYEFDLQWLERCDALLRVPGQSVGADAEEKWMREHNKPVFYNLNALVTVAAQLNRPG